MAITRQIQQHGMSIWSKPSIIFVIMLFIGAGVQYNEYLNVCRGLSLIMARVGFNHS